MAWYPVNFSEYMKKHIHFSKVEDNTWLVQSNPESRCEAYYVSVNDFCIVMFGDYDGVIVRPNCSGRDSLVRWMANATTLSYFVEKVHNGNQYHETMKFDKDTCYTTILEHFMDRFELDNDLKPFIKESMNKCNSYNNIESEFEAKLSRILECHEDNLEELYNHKYQHKYGSRSEINFENMIKMLDDILGASFENEYEFYDWMQEHEFYDVDKYDYMAYTHAIKWQHECLLWWSRHILETDPAYMDKVEVLK